MRQVNLGVPLDTKGERFDEWVEDSLHEIERASMEGDTTGSGGGGGDAGDPSSPQFPVWDDSVVYPANYIVRGPDGFLYKAQIENSNTDPAAERLASDADPINFPASQTKWYEYIERFPFNRGTATVTAYSGFPYGGYLASGSGYVRTAPVPGQVHTVTAMYAGPGGQINIGGDPKGDLDLTIALPINALWRNIVSKFQRGSHWDGTVMQPSPDTEFAGTGGATFSIIRSSRGGLLRMTTGAVAGSSCLLTWPYHYTSLIVGNIEFWKFLFYPHTAVNQTIECGLTVADAASSHKLFWTRTDSASEGSWVESAKVGGALTTIGTGQFTGTSGILRGFQKSTDVQFMAGYNPSPNDGQFNAMLYTGAIAQTYAYQSSVTLMPYVYLETSDNTARSLEFFFMAMSTTQ